MIDIMSSQNIDLSFWDILYVFCHHLHIPQESPDGLSEPKHVVSRLIKTFVRVTVTPSL
jgi:hypothetical protein